MLAEAWPLASDLQNLLTFVRGHDSAPLRAVAELIAAFGRRAGEAVPLEPAVVEIDERHAQGLTLLDERLARTPAPCLVDSDRGAILASPTSILDTAAGPVIIGRGLVRPDPAGSEMASHPFFVRFDVGGVRLERSDTVVSAMRLAQHRIDGRTQWEDLDTGATVDVPGPLVAGPRDGRVPRRLHVETRPLPAAFLAQARHDLRALVDAALQTGHPIRLPDRFSGLDEMLEG
ncbi:MAG: hypothetical protein KDK70_41700 [Myxococcales bacterium]|nr:hypothetical protein [Myxococcales bacterium]